jgi:hypothetical protein
MQVVPNKKKGESQQRQVSMVAPVQFGQAMKHLSHIFASALA